ncbi:hypothetical protein Bca4012_081794 [Brassica carinata]
MKRMASTGLQIDSVLGRKTENLKEISSVGGKLGQGQFGTTFLCVDKKSGQELACKTIAKRKLTTPEGVEDIVCAYEDAVAVHVVMEICSGGELFDRIIQRGHYTERKAAELARTIVGVIEACHSLGVAICAGVIIYILLSGVPPFWDETEQGIFEQVLKAHPWARVDVVAVDKPRDSAVLTRLTQFSAMNKLKKIAIKVIAKSLSEEEIAGLKEMFKMIDTELQTIVDTSLLANLKDESNIDNNGTIDYGEFIATMVHLNWIWQNGFNGNVAFLRSLRVNRPAHELVHIYYFKSRKETLRKPKLEIENLSKEMLRNFKTAPEYANAKTAVWWDMDTCPVPDGYDAGRVRPSIEGALKELGYYGPVVTITAMGNLKEAAPNLLQRLSSTGILVQHAITGGVTPDDGVVTGGGDHGDDRSCGDIEGGGNGGDDSNGGDAEGEVEEVEIMVVTVEAAMQSSLALS